MRRAVQRITFRASDSLPIIDCVIWASSARCSSNLNFPAALQGAVPSVATTDLAHLVVLLNEGVAGGLLAALSSDHLLGVSLG